MAKIIGADDELILVELRCFADLGVQAAELVLAQRLETGDGVPRDLPRAAVLYERAAADIPTSTAVYSPPVRPGGAGRVILVANPNARTGSAEARYRLGLMLIEGRGVEPNIGRGRRLIERAAAAGHAAARQWVTANPSYEPR